MDAESRKRRRESVISLREQRLSMSPQRLEQIVAELMRPVSHLGQSFDRDDSGLLEEYLTAAGLHVLAEEEAGRATPAVPNYAELGMLLQSVANNYSRKVDLLWNLFFNFNFSLGTADPLESSDLEADTSGSSPGAGGARRRASSGGGGGGGAGAGFQPISLSASASARRGAGPSAPPPTLPRVYAELQPRATPARPERTLLDYDLEPIGALDDFHLAWRLQDGLLVEELESGSGGGAELRPLSLLELQEACARAAAPAPPALTPHTPPPASPPPASPPPASPPLTSPSLASPTPPMPPPAALKRKRRSEVRLDDLLPGTLEFEIDADVMRRLRAVGACEFSVPERWVRRVLRHRCDAIRAARRALAPSPPPDFRGFDMSWTDIGGFRGWCASEAAEARRKAAALGGDSDDDGFFERSSDCSRHSPAPDAETAGAGELEAWRRSVVQRCDASAPLDLRVLARDVRNALPPAPAAVPWRTLAADTRRVQPQPARVLLDILMKASRGEVEILPGAPLSVGEFSVRVLTGAGAGARGQREPPPPPPPEEP